MDKTIHKKLTEKHFYKVPALAYAGDRGTVICSSAEPGFETEMKMLHDAAMDLLTPRPQAIARLLQMAREL